MIPDILQPDAFEAALREQLESEIYVNATRSWYPSSLGHPCDRFLVWSFTRWSEKQRHSWVMQAIFDEGRMHMPSIYERLEKMGFEVFRESDRPIQFKVGNAVISGKKDGVLRGFKGRRFDKSVVAEIKTAQGHAFEKLDTIEDVKNAREHWVRGYYTQANLYAFIDEYEVGALIIKSKATGLLKVLPFERDLGAAEEIITRVERLQPLVEAEVDPPPIRYSESVCGRCAFRGSCYPPKDFGRGAEIMFDEELVDKIERRDKLAAAASEYDALDKQIKTQLKATDLGRDEESRMAALCGSYLIQVTRRPIKGYAVKSRVDRIWEFTRLDPANEVAAHVKAQPTEAEASPSPTNKPFAAPRVEVADVAPEPPAAPAPPPIAIEPAPTRGLFD